MRLSCLQENLSRGLGVVGRAVATRTTLPITQHVLISTDQSRLKLSATNLEIAITTWIGAQVEQEGTVTVPARLLTEFVAALSRDTIAIQSSASGGGVDLKCARVEAHINGADPAEFPPIPSVDQGITAQIESEALREAIHHVVFAAAVEDSRPVLTGVSLDIEGDHLTLAAADGYRLAVYNTRLSKPADEALTVIVPARTLQEVERLLDGQTGPIDLVVTPQRSQVMFKMKDTEIVSQLIQGTFPNYRQLIPEKHDTRIIVGLQDLQRATRTASVFAKDGSGIIRLQVTADPSGQIGKLTVSSRAEEVGDNTGDLEAEVEGADGKIAFNSRYLSDVLGIIGKEKVALEMTTSASPGVIRPVDDETYIHVVMPMFVQWAD
jgi:DNA polymerase-3 subunit beta